jgi:SAM-dependent methyltransferase
MSKYDPNWVSQYYDNYGDREWERWENSPADRVRFYLHSYYIKQNVKSGDRVLELGAGAGRFTQILANLGAEIFVADISKVQLQLNQIHAKELGFDRAVDRWIELDMCDLNELSENYFDVVVCYGGPLSYVFDRKDLALQEIYRVLKSSGKALLGVMSLWGTIHEFFPSVLDVPVQQNAEIIKTGDLHPDIYENVKHRCHLFTAFELNNILQANNLIVDLISASNCLSAAWGDRLNDILKDPDRWSELLRMELEASRSPGCLDLGTHLIAVCRKLVNSE